MMDKISRFLELGLIGLFSILAVNALKLNDIWHTVLYITAALVTMVWIIIDNTED